MIKRLIAFAIIAAAVFNCSVYSLNKTADKTEPYYYSWDEFASQYNIFSLISSGCILKDIGWSTEPYLDSHVLWVAYTKSWDVCDMYKTSIPITYIQTAKTNSVSVKTGFIGSQKLNAKEAAKFNLKVNQADTVEYSIPVGTQLNGNAWTIMCVRPYIYYYTDTYKGVYKVALINFYTGETVKTINIEATAKNVYVLETSSRVWSRINTSRDPNAATPVAPLDWEW
jgi:hypothetical protein